MTTSRLPFEDPIHRGAKVTLIVDPTAPLFDALTVEHPGCKELADVSVDLDAFFCTTCHWNGRISGAWAFDMWERAQ